MEHGCATERKALAARFKEYRKVFIALGDGDRQGIYVILLQPWPIGMRVPETTKNRACVRIYGRRQEICRGLFWVESVLLHWACLFF